SKRVLVATAFGFACLVGLVGATAEQLLTASEEVGAPQVVFAAAGAGQGAGQGAGRTDAEAIADAMSAAPTAISEDATILEWPSEPDGDFRVLREGTNGWSCIASTTFAREPFLPNPSCDDAVWLEFEHAYIEGRDPLIEGIGIAYMLSGDAGTSNTDPFATGPTDDNEWHVSGPHLMILVPDPAMLEGVSTDPHNGGPYVMFAGTPYAHIMVPAGDDQR
ncbi:MAG TPA: hypothetical protein VFD39_05640, partial [Trueperaceae bacterium]|nr:hypothetical protein [Trueperaceae bacterium]